MKQQDINIMIRYGSDFQFELFDDVLRATIDTLNNMILDKHKKNSTYYSIDCLDKGEYIRKTVGGLPR